MRRCYSDRARGDRPRRGRRLVALAVAAAASSLDGPSPGSTSCCAFTAVDSFGGRAPRSVQPPLAPCSGPPRPSAKVTFFRPHTVSTALRASSSSNKTKPPPLPKTDDPFLLLGLDAPTTDAKEIKRAYRKRAMQYHPDVILSTDSTGEERDEASKDFARINAAYEMLSGGGKGGVGSASGGTGASSSASSGPYNYQPPHRRQSSYSSSSQRPSTSWEDFMPRYEEEDAKYDAGGDSFGAIFSDLLTGAAGYAAGVAGGGGGGGIVGDFIEFLERNVDGFESGYDDDRSLSQLLAFGSFDEVASEMDETDVLVTSLETKLGGVENELMQAQADLAVASKFSERLDIEERVAELKAREKVVKGYLKKGKKRLIRLRERYKELMVEGRGGRGYGSGSGSRGSGGATGSGSYSGGGGGGSSSSSYDRAPGPAPQSYSSPPAASESTPPAPAPSPASSSSKSWRNEGFSGSYGRRSSGSRRGSRSRGGGEASSADGGQPAAGEQQSSWQSNQQQQQQQQQQRRASDNVYSSGSRAGTGSGSSSGTSSTSNAAPQKYEPWVPPHRRTQSAADRTAQDKRRLRELQVEDDFEKLKREMGL